MIVWLISIVCYVLVALVLYAMVYRRTMSLRISKKISIDELNERDFIRSILINWSCLGVPVILIIGFIFVVLPA